MTKPDFEPQLVRWRHHLHRHPETGFEELQTADYVASVLKALGLEVHRGIGGTGLVANLAVGDGKGVIGLRAEMDALAITETAEGRDYASQTPGRMHACGHDGHMTMVLGAAQLLRERRNFNGTVRFIFQPAEEHGRGAKAMMDDGLFERFPVDEIYGAHNMPGLPAGHFATRAGGIMASEDNFVIHVKGRCKPSSRARWTRACRRSSPAPSSSPTAYAMPFPPTPSSRATRAATRPRCRPCWKNACAKSALASATHGAECAFEYSHEFAPTVNWDQCVPTALAAATAIVGVDKVDGNVQPMMISEDFGAFLRVVPGAFVFIGNGDSGAPGGTPLHNARYDFNDSLLPVGARYFAELARIRLQH